MFNYSARSLRSLQGVHPDLVRVAHRAIQMTPIDFVITEGLRTLERQQQLVRLGASQTLNSRHLTGHAIDIVPLVDHDGDGDTEVRYDWPLFFPIAEAFASAGRNLNVPLRWGGVWDRRLTDLHDCAAAHTAYVARERRRQIARGIRPERVRVFVDGPHFELPREIYT